MLEGASNVALWLRHLKPALDALDTSYWHVLHSSAAPYDGIPKPIPPRAEVIQLLSKCAYKVPEPVPQECIDNYIHLHYLKPNEILQDWLAKDKVVHALFMSTLQGHIKDRVANTKHAFEAYNIIKNLYRALMPNTVTTWNKWTNYFFEEHNDAKDFVDEWNDRLEELLKTCGQGAVSTRAQILQFVAAATRRQESVSNWARYLRVDMDAPDSLKRVQADFLLDQDCICDPDYFCSFERGHNTRAQPGFF